MSYQIKKKFIIVFILISVISAIIFGLGFNSGNKKKHLNQPTIENGKDVRRVNCFIAGQTMNPEHKKVLCP